MIDSTWNTFLDFVRQDDPESLARVNPPASEEQLATAVSALGSALPDEVRDLYLLANGFGPNSFLLRDDYRLLPLDEMVAASMDLVGETVAVDAEAGVSLTFTEPSRLVLFDARDGDDDVERVCVRARKTRTRVELWFKQGGIHDFEELVDTELTLSDWFDEVLEYYR